jgi:uncharacterized membrane protein YedE/YeeE
MADLTPLPKQLFPKPILFAKANRLLKQTKIKPIAHVRMDQTAMALVYSRPINWTDYTGTADFRKQILWNKLFPSAHLCGVRLFFVGGILLGGIAASLFLDNPAPMVVHPELKKELAQYGVTNYSELVPMDLMNWDSLFSLRGFLLMVIGGLLVGFGTRYAGGCTSGHAIMGLSTLQWPSLVATICFMVGGFLTANLLLPLILSL